MTSACDAIAAHLAQALPFGSPVYLLVDPMLGEPLLLEELVPDPAQPMVDEESTATALISALNKARSRAWGGAVYPILLTQRIKLPPHLHPYLVALADCTAQGLTETIETALHETAQALEDGLLGQGAAPHRIGGWLQTGRDPREITGHLGRLMSVSGRLSSEFSYLRLADRRALFWAHQVLGGDVMSAALGCLGTWAYLDPLGQVTVLQASSDTGGDLQWQATQWQRFLGGGVLHPAVARYLGHLQGAAPQDNSIRVYGRAEAALVQARLAEHLWPLRFTTEHDISAWVALSMIRPSLHTQRPVVALMGGDGVSPHKPSHNLHSDPLPGAHELTAQLLAIATAEPSAVL